MNTECNKFIPNDSAYPLCNNPQCKESLTCNISEHMDETIYDKDFCLEAVSTEGRKPR
jgi:hypothetical protein